MASKPLCLVSAGHQARRRETNHRNGIKFRNFCEFLRIHTVSPLILESVEIVRSYRDSMRRFLYLIKVLINPKINALIVTATQIATKIGRVQNDNLIINQWLLYPRQESMI